MKTFLKFMVSSVLFVVCWSFLAFAQAPSPAASPVAVVSAASQGGIMGWVTAHGGIQAAALMLVFSAFTLLSAVRTVLLKYDGLDLGQPIPADYKGLTLVNKLCLLGGNVIDFLTGNTQHT